jgi:predicted  nucleic acid-binding Zn-ribbon protein
MSEQIQVREGVWRTRDGREIVISLRDFGDAEPTSFVWFSKSTGEYETWLDNGRNTLSKFPQPLDLIEYLRPLPGTQPTPEAAPEPQQVQVCAGVWLTRDGEHVEVRARDMTGNESSEWQWLGRRKNLLATWRNDGTLNASREQSTGDLVQFLRPLPEPETTTDTLAEIEAGMAEIEKDVAELVQQDEACRLQAELVLVTAERETLRADLTEVASERDALVREINVATAARDRLEQQMEVMTSERDILAQRLWTKPSEEALQKQNAKQQIEINTLKDRLGDMTTDRDQSASAVLRVTADRDGLLQTVAQLQRQLASMTSERDEVATELLAMTDHCSQQQEQLQATTADRDRLAGELANAQRLAADLRSEVDFVRTQKTAQEHELRAEIGRLQRELQQARIEIDAAGQQPAPADTSEQIERIWDEARERAVSEIIELITPLQVATGTHAEAVLQILPAVIRRWMDNGGCDDVE